MAGTTTISTSSTVPAQPAQPFPPASLYVGDLDSTVSESQLYEKFSATAPVISVRICKDNATGRSLRYGYVNFQSRTDAEKAIQMLNGSLLSGKAIRINWSRRDPQTRRNSAANLFVKNLSDKVDHNGLNEMFAKYGNILSCKVAMGENGKSRGFGFVQFEKLEDADNAVANMNGTIVGDKPLYVGKFVRKNERVVPNENSFRNLYVKNLDQDVVNEDMLKEKFSEIGDVSSCVMMRDDQGKPRGFGFICYRCPTDAKKAVDLMNGKLLGSKTLYVGRAQKKEERKKILQHLFEERRKEKIIKTQGSNVYVKNIVDSVDDDQLKDHFSSCGKITSVKVMRDEKGMSKGFGFVCFSSPDEANKAVSTFHSTIFHGKPMYVSIAELKKIRHARLQLLHSQPGLTTASPPAAQSTNYSPIYLSHAQDVMVPHFSSSPHQAILYPRLGWKFGGILPKQGLHDTLPLPMRQQKQFKGHINGFAPSPVLQHGPFVAHWQLPVEQQFSKHASNYQKHEKNNGQLLPKAAMGNSGLGKPAIFPFSPQSSLNVLSGQLALAAPEKQKQMLGEHLFPHVQRLQHDLAGKITGMLLEMENSDLLLLLESPDALAAKVEEAMQVLKLSKTELDSKEATNGNQQTVEVAAN
ncbi:unnamed protein product [Victoria cruziana]